MSFRNEARVWKFYEAGVAKMQAGNVGFVKFSPCGRDDMVV